MRGLIDYITVEDEKIEAAGLPPAPIWKRIVRPRTVLYTALWASIGVGMVISLFMRDTIDISIARDRNPTYVTLSDGSIRNGYTVKITNQNPEPREFTLSFRSELPLEAHLQGIDGLRFEAPADKTRSLRMFLTAPPSAAPAEPADVEVWIEDQTTHERASVETVFVGPSREKGE